MLMSCASSIEEYKEPLVELTVETLKETYIFPNVKEYEVETFLNYYKRTTLVKSVKIKYAN